MRRLCFFLLLTGLGGTVPSSVGAFPPEGALLIMNRSEVTLRWKLPRGAFTAELWSQGSKRMEAVVSDASWTVPVSRGQNYGWILRNSSGIVQQGRFGVAEEATFSANGRDGTAGRPGPAGGPGQPGTNGGQIEAELQRDEAGMHLRIRSRDQNLHYLFVDSDVRFAISARGGNGGDGAAGDDFRGYQAAVGHDGGAAGWGGSVKVTTYNAPWRQYLEVDLTPGTPGAGGKGGKYRVLSTQEEVAPDGKGGKPGQGGRVDTRLGP
ncbi:hypothetical protein ABS71_16180 [bacterium SCN 62-11]|nr:hypothetical protein [Candidatus Eremiobacteraeota bacterium]ODT62146.1 MAG: hypothetical protein ABS71_16180 [bacterium SCN 62-11]